MILITDSWVKVMNLSTQDPKLVKKIGKLQQKRKFTCYFLLCFACFGLGGFIDGMELAFEYPEYAENWKGGS